MLSFSRILVPIDFSQGAANALRYALAMREGDLAKGARITVAHAVDLDTLEVVEGARSVLRDFIRWRETGRAFVAEVTGKQEQDIDVEIVTKDARSGLPDLAERHDLVVVGARSSTALADLAPGGVAEALMRRSPVPVITVKPRPRKAAGRDVGWPPAEIVLATDLTTFSQAALRHTLAVAFATDARVTALHVVPDSRTLRESERLPAALGLEIDAFYEKELAWKRDELGRFLRDREGAPRPIEIREAARVGDPAHEITAECLERNAELLVMATHGGSGLKKWLLGSVAEKAARMAPCAVMTVRPPE